MDNILQLKQFDVDICEICFINEDIMQKGGIFKRQNDPKEHNSFVYVYDGEAIYDFFDYSMTVKKDNLFYIKHGSKYNITALSEQYRYAYIDHKVAPIDMDKFKNKIYINNAILLKPIFENLVGTWHYKKPGYLLDAKYYAYGILRQIIKEEAKGLISHKKYSRIEKAVEYMEKNYMKWNISIDTLSQISDISTSQLRRIFKEVYSVSPLTYLNILRIDHSKDLLKHTNLTVTQISEQLGYPDVYSFSKQFRKLSGLPPSQYRRKY